MASVPPSAGSAADDQDAARLLRRTLGSYPTGVTIVTTRTAAGRAVGLTVNSFASLSLHPPLLLWSLANKSPNLEAFRNTRHFAINVLAHDQHELAMRFATPHILDKFDGVALRSEPQAQAMPTPLIDGTLAWFVCTRRDTVETGDHTLFIGRIDHHACGSGAPLVFHGGAFTRLCA